MFQQLKNLYVELESIDINLLICIQNKAMHSVAPHLRTREKKLAGISLLMSDLSGGDVDREEHEVLAAMQSRTLLRSERIRMMLSHLHAEAKQGFVKFSSVRTRPTPYAHKPAAQHRVKA